MKNLEWIGSFLGVAGVIALNVDGQPLTANWLWLASNTALLCVGIATKRWAMATLFATYLGFTVIGLVHWAGQ